MATTAETILARPSVRFSAAGLQFPTLLDRGRSGGIGGDVRDDDADSLESLDTYSSKSAESLDDLPPYLSPDDAPTATPSEGQQRRSSTRSSTTRSSGTAGGSDSPARSSFGFIGDENAGNDRHSESPGNHKMTTEQAPKSSSVSTPVIDHLSQQQIRPPSPPTSFATPTKISVPTSLETTDFAGSNSTPIVANTIQTDTLPALATPKYEESGIFTPRVANGIKTDTLPALTAFNREESRNSTPRVANDIKTDTLPALTAVESEESGNSTPRVANNIKSDTLQALTTSESDEEHSEESRSPKAVDGRDPTTLSVPPHPLMEQDPPQSAFPRINQDGDRVVVVPYQSPADHEQDVPLIKSSEAPGLCDVICEVAPGAKVDTVNQFSPSRSITENSKIALNPSGLAKNVLKLVSPGGSDFICKLRYAACIAFFIGTQVLWFRQSSFQKKKIGFLSQDAGESFGRDHSIGLRSFSNPLKNANHPQTLDKEISDDEAAITLLSSIIHVANHNDMSSAIVDGTLDGGNSKLENSYVQLLSSDGDSTPSHGVPPTSDDDEDPFCLDASHINIQPPLDASTDTTDTLDEENPKPENTFVPMFSSDSDSTSSHEVPSTSDDEEDAFYLDISDSDIQLPLDVSTDILDEENVQPENTFIPMFLSDSNSTPSHEVLLTSEVDEDVFHLDAFHDDIQLAVGVSTDSLNEENPQSKNAFLLMFPSDSDFTPSDGVPLTSENDDDAFYLDVSLCDIQLPADVATDTATELIHHVSQTIQEDKSNIHLVNLMGTMKDYRDVNGTTNESRGAFLCELASCVESKDATYFAEAETDHAAPPITGLGEGSAIVSLHQERYQHLLNTRRILEQQIPASLKHQKDIGVAN